MEDANTVAMPMHANVIRHHPNDGLAIKAQEQNIICGLRR